MGKIKNGEKYKERIRELKLATKTEHKVGVHLVPYVRVVCPNFWTPCSKFKRFINFYNGKNNFSISIQLSNCDFIFCVSCLQQLKVIA